MPKLDNMTRAERERFIYAAVRQKTYDPALARKLRGWSAERILTTYGIDVRRKRILKPLPPSAEQQVRIAKTRLEIAKYQYLLEQGFSVTDAKRLKRRSWNLIKRLRTMADVPKRVIQDTEREVKKEKWGNWVKNKSFPKRIRDAIIKENRIANKANPRIFVSDDSDVGWYITYMSYINNDDPNNYRTMIKPDPFDGDRYRELIETGTVQ